MSQYEEWTFPVPKPLVTGAAGAFLGAVSLIGFAFGVTFPWKGYVST